MLSPRWSKLAGDVAQSQGRLATMAVAIAVGVFAVAAISTAYTILTRELDRSYLATNPATAVIDVDPLDDATVAAVRRRPGIAWAESAGRLAGRVEVRPGEWLPALLFVVPDFTHLRIGAVRLESGVWPQEAGIVLERTALAVAHTVVGGAITLQTQGGKPHSLNVTGVVHDPSLAPAWQQQTVYGYLTPATVRLLGESSDLHSLKLIVSGTSGDAAGVEHIVADVAGWLKRMGHAVREIRIPPPHHPHQEQMSSVTRMLLVFSALSLLLSAILTATLTANLLAPQVRQIGVMKAIGARSTQILGLYVVLVAVLGIVAVGVGLPLGIAGGRALALNVAHVLNLDLASLAVSNGMYFGQAVAGVGLPLLLSLYPIISATRRTVRESLNDYGAGQPSSRIGPLARYVSRALAHDAALMLAVRNGVRRKARLVLTLGLLGTAGALFMTSLNIKAAWEQNLANAAAERHFDIEVHLVRSAPVPAVIAAVSAVQGVRRAEPFSEETAALARKDGLDIVRTFPDGGHGSLRVNALPPTTAFVKPDVIEGHWLDSAGNAGAIVNLQAMSFFPGAKVGDWIHLMVRGRAVDLHIEGIVREHLTGAVVYTSEDTYAQSMAEPHLTGGVRIALQSGDPEQANSMAAAIERSLEKSGFQVAQSTSQTQIGRALAGHLYILIFVLIVMSLLMALVGILGLASAMTTGVLERTREFAVMRAVGASNTAILRTVIGEGVFVGTLSVAAATVLSAPLTMAVAQAVGTSSLGPALGVVSTAAMPLWLIMVLVGAAAASAYPAWTASKLTIREALAYQ
jgi:putative ABC transport system permease protein